MRRAALCLALTASGCVASRGSTFAPVAADVEARVGVRPAWRDAALDADLRRRLAEPLDRDAAVRVALSASARLQAAYEELGVAAADVAAATGLGPTEVHAEYHPGGEHGGELEVDVVQDVLALLQLPQRRGAARGMLAAARARAVGETVALVARVEAAFYDAVAAAQIAALRRTEFAAADAAALLAERQRKAGNIPALALAERQAAREDARLDHERATADAAIAREELAALLGVEGAIAVVDRLPELPGAAPSHPDLERTAIDASLELRALRAESDAADSRLGVARVRTILPSLGAGVAASRGDDGEWHYGPAVHVGLPIFDWSSGARARAHADRRRIARSREATRHELAARARAARHELDVAYREARHLRDVVLPLHQQIVKESVLQYNAMNRDTFELLRTRRDQVDAARRQVDAARRFFIAASRVAALRRGVAVEMARHAGQREAAPAAEGGH